MRVVILAMCGLIAGGVFVTMLLSLWGTRCVDGCTQPLRQSAVSELVWAAIPCLMVIAAAIPAVLAIMTSSPGH